MLLKIIVIVLLVVILYCLGSAVVYLVRGDQSSVKMAKALTWRISLSLVLFLLVVLSFLDEIGVFFKALDSRPARE